MLVGVSRAFKAMGHSVRVVALEPASSPVLELRPEDVGVTVACDTGLKYLAAG